MQSQSVLKKLYDALAMPEKWKYLKCSKVFENGTKSKKLIIGRYCNKSISLVFFLRKFVHHRQVKWWKKQMCCMKGLIIYVIESLSKTKFTVTHTNKTINAKFWWSDYFQLIITISFTWKDGSTRWWIFKLKKHQHQPGWLIRQIFFKQSTIPG